MAQFRWRNLGDSFHLVADLVGYICCWRGAAHAVGRVLKIAELIGASGENVSESFEIPPEL